MQQLCFHIFEHLSEFGGDTPPASCIPSTNVLTFFKNLLAAILQIVAITIELSKGGGSEGLCGGM
jgi:hypothetical protein